MRRRRGGGELKEGLAEGWREVLAQLKVLGAAPSWRGEGDERVEVKARAQGLPAVTGNKNGHSQIWQTF